MHADGLCRKCGKSSEYFCDACGLYFCEDHLIKVPIPDTEKFFIFCEKCHKKGKKPVAPRRQDFNPIYK